MCDHPIVDHQFSHWHTPVFGGALKQGLARVGRCNAQLAATLRNGDGCAREPLVRCGAGVAHDHVNAAKAHIQLVCGNLAECRFGARAQIYFAHIKGNAVVFVNGQPRVECIFGYAFGRGKAIGRLRCTTQRKAYGQDPSASSTQKLTSIEVAHRALLRR